MILSARLSWACQIFYFNFKRHIIFKTGNNKSYNILYSTGFWVYQKIIARLIQFSKPILAVLVCWNLWCWSQEGQALKMLATAARLDIEDFVGKEVFVEVCLPDKILYWPEKRIGFPLGCLYFSFHWLKSEEFFQVLMCRWSVLVRSKYPYVNLQNWMKLVLWIILMDVCWKKSTMSKDYTGDTTVLTCSRQWKRWMVENESHWLRNRKVHNSRGTP